MFNITWKIISRLFASSFFLFTVISCQCSQPKDKRSNVKEASEISHKDSNNDDSSIGGGDGLILMSAEKAFSMIPDHKKVSIEAKDYMTSDLYEALALAWEIPMWGDGEIGSEVFLYQFVTGNGGSVVDRVSYSIILESPIMENNQRKVELKYMESWDGEDSNELSTIVLYMVYENGKWLLDDFGGNSVKNQCKQYILEEVNEYLSGRTVQYMKSSQHDEWYTDEHINKVKTSFNNYIAQNKQYLDCLKGTIKIDNNLNQNLSKEEEVNNEISYQFNPQDYEKFWDRMVPMWKNNRIKAEKTYQVNTRMKLALGLDKIVECSADYKYKLISQGGLDDFFIGYTNDDDFVELDYPCYVCVTGIFDEFYAAPYNLGSREERYYTFIDLQLDAVRND